MTWNRKDAHIDLTFDPFCILLLTLHHKPKLVKKERASAVEGMIANMAMQGKLDSKISEGKLIEMLEGIVGAQQKKEADKGKISIQRKKYNFDSDDDDDDDDLL